MRELAALPKAHLHLHLYGAVRGTTYVELAESAGLPAPLPSSYDSFAEFIETIVAVGRVLRTEAELQRVTRELVEDAVADGAVWIEPSISPGANAELVDQVLQAGLEAGREYGVGFGLLVSVNRGFGPAVALDTARSAVERADAGVVGLGLDGDENAFSVTDFVPAFEIAREAGLSVRPHAGELTDAASVRDVLDLLAADGVQHGIRALDDPALVERLARTGTALHVCPTSNAMLSVVPSLAEHPLPDLLDAGVRCSVNADDPLLFGTDLLTEYERCRSVLGLSDERLAAVARTSIEASCAPAGLKARALAGVDGWLAA